MRVRFSERFRRSYESVPPAIQRTFHRKLEFLLQDLRHPSLRAKKYEGDIYRLHDITAHPK